MDTLCTAASVLAIALVHIWVAQADLPRAKPRSAWLSLAGGAALAYVFVYVLPKLAAKQDILLRASDAGILGFLEHHAYLVALAGFLVFYGVDRAIESTRDAATGNVGSTMRFHLAFDLEVAAFAAYNVLLGYLIVNRQTPGMMPLLLITIAFVLHVLGSDYGLRSQNPAVYARLICWLLVGCIVLGWTLGQFVTVSDPVLALWFAFLAGAITIIVIKDEMPSAQHARFWPFLAGAASYTGLLLTIEVLRK
jgi:zinc transporter ZupT